MKRKQNFKSILVDDYIYFFEGHKKTSICFLVFLMCFSGAIGYFWGHVVANQQFVDYLRQEALADHINTSFYTIIDSKSEPEADAEQKTDTDITDEENSQDQSDSELTPSGTPQFVAQIAGFSTERAAQKFADSLKAEGYSIRVVRNQSRTKNGKEVNWYQVVTEPVPDRKLLEQQLVQIRRKAHLKDEPIIEEKMLT